LEVTGWVLASGFLCLFLRHPSLPLHRHPGAGRDPV